MYSSLTEKREQKDCSEFNQFKGKRIYIDNFMKLCKFVQMRERHQIYLSSGHETL